MAWFEGHMHEILEAVRQLQQNDLVLARTLQNLKSDHHACCKETQAKLNQIIELQSLMPVYGTMALQFGTPTPTQEDKPMGSASVPGQETDTQTIPCTEVETDGQGNPVPLNPASVVWAIDDPTIATLTQNADGSATFQAVKPVPPAVNPRTANITCTDTVTNVVGTNTLTVTDSPTKPGTMVLTFGTPTP